MILILHLIIINRLFNETAITKTIYTTQTEKNTKFAYSKYRRHSYD